jgi:hypothetical protein
MVVCGFDLETGECTANPWGCGMSTPSVQQVLEDPCINYRLKNWLREALKADALDAYYDAQLLADVLRQRLDQILKGGD